MGGGGGWVCTVIFVSNPTAVLRLRLCCVVVGVVTKIGLYMFLCSYRIKFIKAFSMIYDLPIIYCPWLGQTRLILMRQETALCLCLIISTCGSIVILGVNTDINQSGVSIILTHLENKDIHPSFSFFLNLLIEH